MIDVVKLFFGFILIFIGMLGLSYLMSIWTLADFIGIFILSFVFISGYHFLDYLFSLEFE